jgi:hypothetical protein
MRNRWEEGRRGVQVKAWRCVDHGGGGPSSRQRERGTGGQDELGRCGDASGRIVPLAQNPGGEPSPWKERAPVDRQRTAGATDPTVEQSLEVEGRRWKRELVHVESAGATTRGQRPQRCGTATGGGTSSGGVKGAAGKCCVRSDASRSSSEGRAASDGTVQKRGEPLPVPGCNKPGNSSAE